MPSGMSAASSRISPRASVRLRQLAAARQRDDVAGDGRRREGEHLVDHSEAGAEDQHVARPEPSGRAQGRPRASPCPIASTARLPDDRGAVVEVDPDSVGVLHEVDGSGADVREPPRPAAARAQQAPRDSGRRAGARRIGRPSARRRMLRASQSTKSDGRSSNALIERARAFSRCDGEHRCRRRARVRGAGTAR